MFYDKKFFLKNRQNICGKSLSLKQAEFDLGGINKLHDKWQKSIQNNDEYTIDLN